MKNLLPALAAFALLISLTVRSAAAIVSARLALALCAETIIPSLFPFFVASRLLCSVGAAEYLGRRLSPLFSRLFGVSGAGAAALVSGLAGGYPLGAATAADLVGRGDISAEEGARLLPFCNNSGPAFIIGAAGAGVFGDAAVGLELYAAHVLAALTMGILMRGRGMREAAGRAPAPSAPPPIGFGEAVTDAVGRSVASVLTVCGFVTAFMVLTGVLDNMGITTGIAGELAGRLGLELSFCRALIAGAFELGGGVASMRGLAPTPLNLALCAFLLGWGGLSVHLQTAAVVADAKIKTSRHTVGRLLAGLIAAFYMLLLRLILGLLR